MGSVVFVLRLETECGGTYLENEIPISYKYTPY